MRHALSLLLTLAASSPGMTQDAPRSVRTYDPDAADQFQWNRLPDVMPAHEAQRETWAHALALDAAVYAGLPVAQYWQMHAQAVDRDNAGYTGFNRFHHDRVLAAPGYKAFKTPNVDTLYSNAWLDLTAGPVSVTIPPMAADRYFTVNLLDVYGDASNISTRIQGNGGGRWLIATTDWRGTVPKGVRLFRVTTPYMWVLLRIKANDARDAKAAAALQDEFVITPATASAAPPLAFPDGRDRSAIGYFRILDFILRANGHPLREDALVYRWRNLGLGGTKTLDQALVDPAIRRGLESGFADARTVIEDSVQQAGLHLDRWRSPYDAGRFGFNFLERTGLMIATGANVPTENYAFVTYVDADGDPLDGSRYSYELVQAPPPARYYWSYTPYLRSNRELIPNPARKYVVNDRTPGMRTQADGTLRVILAATKPTGVPSANWLPVSAAPFVLAIRAQGPDERLLSGKWVPAPIRKLTPVRR